MKQNPTSSAELLQAPGIMASQSQVPKFGNWETEDVPYTVYFEKAKKGRNAKKNSQIPDSSSNNEPSFQAREEAEVKIGDSTKSRNNHEDVDLKKSTDTSKKVSRQSVGSDRSFDNSPMHPHQQPRVGNKGSAGSSPMNERKGSLEASHGAPSSTPGRSRLRQATRDETSDDGPAIPKFGAWDDSDPTSGEGYTHIFNKAREDKNTAGGKPPMITTENANFYGQRNDNHKSKGCGCFSWGRK